MSIKDIIGIIFCSVIGFLVLIALIHSWNHPEEIDELDEYSYLHEPNFDDDDKY